MEVMNKRRKIFPKVCAMEWVSDYIILIYTYNWNPYIELKIGLVLSLEKIFVPTNIVLGSDPYKYANGQVLAQFVVAENTVADYCGQMKICLVAPRKLYIKKKKESENKIFILPTKFEINEEDS